MIYALLNEEGEIVTKVHSPDVLPITWRSSEGYRAVLIEDLKEDVKEAKRDDSISNISDEDTGMVLTIDRHQQYAYLYDLINMAQLEPAQIIDLSNYGLQSMSVEKSKAILREYALMILRKEKVI